MVFLSTLMNLLYQITWEENAEETLGNEDVGKCFILLTGKSRFEWNPFHICYIVEFCHFK